MKVVTLNNNRFKETCLELVSKFSLKPDLVISILNGGNYILNEIKKEAKFKKIHSESVKLKSNEKFENYTLGKFILKILPYSITNRLRIFQSQKVKKSIKIINTDDLLKENTTLLEVLKTNKEITNILIVDDAIDTGKTMFKVKNMVKNSYPSAKIETAVISWTLENSIIKPDYFIFKNVLVRFPWSNDYKGNDFE